MSDWYLKKSNGTVYGPVAVGTLVHWAADGRIVPEDAVSTDREQWAPAPSLGELAMDWLITLPDGSSYGPLHILAVKELIRDGSVAMDSIVTHRRTGDRRKAGDAILEAILGQEENLHSRLAALMTRVHDLESELEAQRKRLERAGPAPAAQPADASPWQAMYEAERRAREEREAELNETIRALRQNESTARQQLELAQHQLARAGRQLDAAAEGQDDSPDVAALLASYNDLSKNYDRLLEQLIGKSAELKSLYEQRAQIERSAADRQKTLEERSRLSENEAAVARQRLAQMEAAHLEVVKAYRELNDRYIRLKQTVSAVAPPRSSLQAAPPQAPEVSKPKVRLI